MSVRVMTAVWSMDLPDSDKLVLLALADCANDEGHCWPSVRSLTIKCSKSERTIQGSIKRLVDEGHLIRREVPGKGCNYTVLPRSSCAPAKNAPAQGTPQTPADSADKPLSNRHSEAKASSERVVAKWNLVGKPIGFIECRVLDASRRQTLRLRIKEHGEDKLLEAIDAAAKSGWLRGEGRDSKWRPDLDFFLQPKTLRRLMEGAYAEDPAPPRRITGEDAIRQAEDTAARFRRIGRDADADEELAKAARLRAGMGVGALAKKIINEARPS